MSKLVLLNIITECVTIGSWMGMMFTLLLVGFSIPLDQNRVLMLARIIEYLFIPFTIGAVSWVITSIELS